MANEGNVPDLMSWISSVGPKKFREELQRSFTSMVSPDERPCGLFWTSDKVGYGVGDDYFVFFTNHRIAVGKTGGFLSAGHCNVIPRGDLLRIEVGSSNHVLYQGVMDPEQTNFLTIRLCLTDGQRIERHVYMGRSEADYNKRIPKIVQHLSFLAKIGYVVVDGVGSSASGGFRTYQGIGVGMWID